MGSFQPEVLAGDRVVGVGRSGQHLAVGFEQLGSESCAHWFEPLLQSHNVTGSVGQHFAGIEKNSLPEGRCNHCRIVAEK